MLNLKNSALLRSQVYIDGLWSDADDNKRIPVLNPATGEVVVEVANVGAAETKRAIAAAEAALPAWRDKTVKERAALLRRWYELVMANQEDLAVLMTAEQGKPLVESKVEIAYGASYLEVFA